MHSAAARESGTHARAIRGEDTRDQGMQVSVRRARGGDQGGAASHALGGEGRESERPRAARAHPGADVVNLVASGAVFGLDGSTLRAAHALARRGVGEKGLHRAAFVFARGFARSHRRTRTGRAGGDETRRVLSRGAGVQPVFAV